MPTLWLVRHPAVEGATGRCYGRLDLRAQLAAVAAVAQRLHARLPARARVVSSPAARAWGLAQALSALRPTMPPPRIDARLHELDFGAWEGCPWDQIPPAVLDAWCTDFAHYAPGGGESVAALLGRVRAALRDLLALGGGDTGVSGCATGAGAGGPTADGERPAWVWITHAGVIRAVRYTVRHGWDATPAAPHQWPQRAPGFGAILRVPLQRLALSARSARPLACAAAAPLHLATGWCAGRGAAGTSKEG
ncbi:histidine phosphatase family protein [Tepidimonas charontis]|uniref:Alpha-ribazole phosphatase n=1 Tax=Tepidimonas charontis TaxID=2267262 RepID=A0A554XKW8_9BURK|nr:histidine phosphatase family protein [Tepidimonas charontis]TSE36481.1 alpha-ribazole phosphatase [Tepidimonas charontis]